MNKFSKKVKQYFFNIFKFMIRLCTYTDYISVVRMTGKWYPPYWLAKAVNFLLHWSYFLCDQWPNSQRDSSPSDTCWIFIPHPLSCKGVEYLFQEAFLAGFVGWGFSTPKGYWNSSSSVGWGMCQRVRNFPHPLFISQSQGGLQKV